MEPFNLGNYRVIRELGRGGMGVVYLAEDLVLHRLVAIKILHPHLTQDADFRERFMVEARNQAKLTHPNITTLFSFEESDGRIFLVMEYLEGETLEQRLIRLSRLSRREMQDIFRQVLVAVEYAHAKGVIHRDLKPGNIAITPENKVKIMDFGIAVQIRGDGGATPADIIGTSYYMAPEQIKGETLSHGTDIYALGVTLFEMVTGRPPFDGPTDHDIRIAHVNKVPPAPRSSGCPNINPELEGVILKALEKDPRERFASAREFLLALETSLSVESYATSESPTSPEAKALPPPWQRHGFTWPSAPATLIILTLGLTLLGGIFFFKPLLFQGDRPTTGGSPPLIVASPPKQDPQVTALSPSPPLSPVPAIPRKEEPAPVPSQSDLIESLNRSLVDHGFGHLKVASLGKKITVTGQVQSSKEKSLVMDLAKVHCPAEQLEFKGLKIRRSVARTSQPKIPPEEMAVEPQRVESPKLPPAPPEGVRFKFGTPTVTKIR